jgi:hypothetical protein
VLHQRAHISVASLSLSTVADFASMYSVPATLGSGDIYFVPSLPTVTVFSGIAPLSPSRSTSNLAHSNKQPREIHRY